MRRTLALSVVGLTGLLAAGCALPPNASWAQVRERGLIPVLIDAKKTEVAANPSKPSSQDAVRVQAVATPVVVKTVYADAVPGRPGYVYSPHASSRSVVDVRGFQSGEEVRCPFTAQPFIVPDFRAIASASKPAPVRPVRSAGEVVLNTPSTTLLDQGLARLEPVVEPQPSATPPVEPVTSGTAAPAARLSIPYGTRVAGRPGFVQSPYAEKSQLVDVVGFAPGVVVECPYTRKRFRVPEPTATEEIRPSTFPGTPASETAETPPAAPERPEPAPVEPTPPAPAPPLAPPASLGSPR